MQISDTFLRSTIHGLPADTSQAFRLVGMQSLSPCCDGAFADKAGHTLLDNEGGYQLPSAMNPA